VSADELVPLLLAGIVVISLLGQALLYVSAAIALRRLRRQGRYRLWRRTVRSRLAPRVSVLMPAYGEEASIVDSVEGILALSYPDLEVVVVNDGSSDGTGAILEAHAAADPRLRVLERQGQGLTRSLIEGCQAARGPFIARQDAGDISLPGRLRRQLRCLEENPDASLCSTHVRLVVPEGATAQVNAPEPRDLADGLTGPAIHGSVMMRRSAYERAGGYRPMFYYAQDIDLWSRMVELGSHLVLPEVLYEATLSPGSISGSRRREQEEFHGLIVAATQARRSGREEAPWLAQAEALAERCRSATPEPRRQADGAYFIGACLARDHPDVARLYLRQALSLNPWHLKARLKMATLP
jgi:glycosyltransferase involved in cell wall biosynthesis